MCAEEDEEAWGGVPCGGVLGRAGGSGGVGEMEGDAVRGVVRECCVSENGIRTRGIRGKGGGEGG